MKCRRAMGSLDADDASLEIRDVVVGVGDGLY